MVRLPGELPCDFLARLTEPASPGVTSDEAAETDDALEAADIPDTAMEYWRAGRDSNLGDREGAARCSSSLERACWVASFRSTEIARPDAARERSWVSLRPR